MADTAHQQRLLPVGYGIVLALIAIIGWHLYLTNSARHEVDNVLADRSLNNSSSISINPFTNLVSITIEMEQTRDDSNLFVSFGDGLLKTVIQLIGPGVLEHQLNTAAREKYDLYAILIPYKVKISMGEVDSESAARFRAERDKKKSEEARIKKEEQERKQKVMFSYIDSSLVLEKLRVGQGSRFGEEVTGVFGTVINKGNKTLNEVKLRIYFLNAKGERIGEKDYYPVLVTKYSFGLADRSPLRPGYRKDFGYSVEHDAPSGWSKRIESAIIEVEFDETPSDGNTKRTGEQAKRAQADAPVVVPNAGLQVQSEPLPPKHQSSQDLAEAIKKAEEVLAEPAQAPSSRTSEEIKKLLNTLPTPAPPTPDDAAPVPINRVWNTATNPAVRQVLESASDSTATMRIVIQPNGEIRDIVLYKSSGNDAYDRAVESVLRDLRRVPPLPDEMKGEPFVTITSFTYIRQGE